MQKRMSLIMNPMSGAGQQDHWPAVQPRHFDLIFGLLKVVRQLLALKMALPPLRMRQQKQHQQRHPLANLNQSPDQ